MTNKTVKLLRIEKQTKIDKQNTPEFLLEYQKAVLLALKEQGMIDDIQCQMCIDKLTEQP